MNPDDEIVANLDASDRAVPALAWAFYAGLAAPALYYVVADWRAGREE